MPCNQASNSTRKTHKPKFDSPLKLERFKILTLNQSWKKYLGCIINQFSGVNMNLTFKAKVGKKRVLVIPKKAAEILSIREGTTVKITIDNDRMIIEPIRDAIWLSLYGEKIANISLKELEEISIEEQGKIIEK